MEQAIFIIAISVLIDILPASVEQDLLDLYRSYRLCAKS